MTIYYYFQYVLFRGEGTEVHFYVKVAVLRSIENCDLKL